MEAVILENPEEIQKIGESDDRNGGSKGIAEGGLKNGNAHQDVVLAVIAIGGGGGEGESYVDEDGDGGDGVKRR
jgi:hypothetical protein